MSVCEFSSVRVFSVMQVPIFFGMKAKGNIYDFISMGYNLAH